MSQKEDLLIEIGTEELPPNSLTQLSNDFAKGIVERISKAQLNYCNYRVFATPRRLAIIVHDLDTQQADQTVERKGPKLEAVFDESGNPTKAGEGFARSCGLEVSDLSDPQYQEDGRLIFRSQQKGHATEALLPSMLTEMLEKLPIKKRMLWGDNKKSFVRPIHWLVVLLGDRTLSEPIWGITPGNQTRGHRFLANHDIEIEHPKDYETKLTTEGFVIAEFSERKAKIKSQINELLTDGLTVDITESLLTEVTGLVEWPQALMAEFDERFLAVPQEALTMSMQVHQKAFPIYKSSGELANQFVLVSNMQAKDYSIIIAGNEKVMRARLADAEFFFQADQSIKLQDRVEKLQNIVFQKDLGSVFEKTERVGKIAGALAEQLSLKSDSIQELAGLCKADLTTDMVGEFPKLQGRMGYYYAQQSGYDEQTAQAIYEHYLPRFAQDKLPQSVLGQVLSVADKLDTIVAITAIGQAPTGEKDPFGLRRAALGIIKILTHFALDIDLKTFVALANQNLKSTKGLSVDETSVLSFIFERQKRLNMDEGIDAKVVNAVMVNQPTHPHDLQRRIEAVSQFSQLSQAESLIAANKRVSNILKKQPGDFQLPKLDQSLFENDAEVELAQKVSDKKAQISSLYSSRDYQGVLSSLSELQQPVDKFFDDVLVMADEESVRNNRLALLAQLRHLFLDIADVSLL